MLDIQSYHFAHIQALFLGSFPAAAFHKRVHEMVARDSRNFDSWTGLVEEVEGMCPVSPSCMHLLLYKIIYPDFGFKYCCLCCVLA